MCCPKCAFNETEYPPINIVIIVLLLLLMIIVFHPLPSKAEHCCRIRGVAFSQKTGKLSVGNMRTFNNHHHHHHHHYHHHHHHHHHHHIHHIHHHHFSGEHANLQ